MFFSSIALSSNSKIWYGQNHSLDYYALNNQSMLGELYQYTAYDFDYHQFKDPEKKEIAKQLRRREIIDVFKAHGITKDERYKMVDRFAEFSDPSIKGMHDWDSELAWAQFLAGILDILIDHPLKGMEVRYEKLPGQIISDSFRKLPYPVQDILWFHPIVQEMVLNYCPLMFDFPST